MTLEQIELLYEELKKLEEKLEETKNIIVLEQIIKIEDEIELLKDKS